MDNNYTPLKDNQQPSSQPTTGYFKQEQQQQPQYQQYQQQPQYQQYQQYQQPAVYVTQPQPVYTTHAATITVGTSHCKKDDEHHVLPSVILFILGWFFFIPWIVNAMYIKSRNGLARGLAIASVVLFVIGIIFTVIWLIVFFVVVDKTIHDTNNWSSNCYYSNGSCY